MLVCHCRAVNHRQIEAAALCGASCVRDIVSACGAGGVCGGCRPAIEEILSEIPTPLPQRSRVAVA
ncbi:MAG TPA: (2Fe-2S)-binding protein [Acidimicrobiales bacterium]|nr:(2Fe-2S)-binding protein [Acidimicrobiales bacterium]